MKILKKQRDKFSGHWWITTKNFTLEVHQPSRYEVDCYNILQNGKVMVEYVKLDRSNVVYPVFYGQVIPKFHTVAALLKWVDFTSKGKSFKIIK